jgi:hypothetical protein
LVGYHVSTYLILRGDLQLSRSFKHTPIFKDSRTAKFGKKQASKALRRFRGEISYGNSYRRFFPSWNIHEYTSYYSKEHYLSDRESNAKSEESGVLRDVMVILKPDSWYRYHFRK